MLWRLTACLFRFALPLFEIALMVASIAETILTMQLEQIRSGSGIPAGSGRRSVLLRQCDSCRSALRPDGSCALPGSR